MNPQIPSRYTYIAFLDLLADTVFNHQMAANEQNRYLASRYARASIIASSLSIECFANCLLTLIPYRKLKNDLEKLPPLSKIEVALRLQGFVELDRGRVEIQKISELIKARNDYVHSKSAVIQASMDTPQDGGNEWVIPIKMTGELWKELGIPKLAMFWSHENSLSTLSAVCAFYRYVLIDTMRADEKLIGKMLISRAEIGNVLMPGVYDEFRELLASASKLGVDFSFLGLTQLAKN